MKHKNKMSNINSPSNSSHSSLSSPFMNNFANKSYKEYMALMKKLFDFENRTDLVLFCYL